MSLSSRDRRASAIGILKPYSVVLPNPDAILEDQADRQQLALVYRGILASAYLPAFATQFTFASAWIDPAVKTASQVIQALLAGSEIIITPRLTAEASTTPSMTFGPRTLTPAVGASVQVQ